MILTIQFYHNSIFLGTLYRVVDILVTFFVNTKYYGKILHYRNKG